MDALLALRRLAGLPMMPTDRTAMEFPNEKALKRYLHEHPDADRSKHKVVKNEGSEKTQNTPPMSLKEKSDTRVKKGDAALKDMQDLKTSVENEVSKSSKVKFNSAYKHLGELSTETLGHAEKLLTALKGDPRVKDEESEAGAAYLMLDHAAASLDGQKFDYAKHRDSFAHEKLQQAEQSHSYMAVANEWIGKLVKHLNEEPTQGKTGARKPSFEAFDDDLRTVARAIQQVTQTTAEYDAFQDFADQRHSGDNTHRITFTVEAEVDKVAVERAVRAALQKCVTLEGPVQVLVAKNLSRITVNNKLEPEITKRASRMNMSDPMNALNKLAGVKTAGYTHYFTVRRDFTEEEWSKIVTLAKKIAAKAKDTRDVIGGIASYFEDTLKKEGIVLKGPMGTGSPVFSATRIALNGDTSKKVTVSFAPAFEGDKPRGYTTDLGHESFILTRKKNSGDFCKTEHKPYDIVVESILAVAKKIAPDAIDVGSDGGSIKRILAADEPLDVAAVTDTTFRAAMAQYLAFLEAMMDAHHKKNFPTLTPDKLSLDWGRRYVRIVKTGGGNSRSVYGFVDRTNGDILKAAGWKAPAIHARGNLFDKASWVKASGPYGMAYLKGADDSLEKLACLADSELPGDPPGSQNPLFYRVATEKASKFEDGRSKKIAEVFPNEKALKKYLDEHPDADKSNHSVEKGDDKPKSKDDEKPAKGDSLKELPAKLPVKDLPPEFREEIADYKVSIVGDDSKQAVEIARKLKKGIDRAADICKMSPSVCKGNKGLTRDKMPQIDGDKSVKDMLASDKPDEKAKGEAMVQAGADPKSDKTVLQSLIAHLKDNGIETKDTTMPVGHMKATQSEIKASKVFEMADAHLKGKYDSIDGNVVVSKDGHILDGHHRWAALLTIDPARKMKVKVIDMTMDDLLKEAAALPGVYKADFAGKPLPEADQKKYKSENKSQFKSKAKSEDKKDEPKKDESKKTARVASSHVQLKFRSPKVAFDGNLTLSANGDVRGMVAVENLVVEAGDRSEEADIAGTILVTGMDASDLKRAQAASSIPLEATIADVDSMSLPPGANVSKIAVSGHLLVGTTKVAFDGTFHPTGYFQEAWSNVNPDLKRQALRMTVTDSMKALLKLADKSAVDQTPYRAMRQQLVTLIAALKQMPFAKDVNFGTWGTDYDIEGKRLNKWRDDTTPALFATVNASVSSPEDAGKVKRWLASVNGGQKYGLVKMKVGMSPPRSQDSYMTSEQWMFYVMLVPTQGEVPKTASRDEWVVPPEQILRRALAGGFITHEEAASSKFKNAADMLSAIRAGDRVTIVNRFGQELSGRAVMRGPAGWVLNMGGRHGTPGIATNDNIVKVKPTSKPSYLASGTKSKLLVEKLKQEVRNDFVRQAITTGEKDELMKAIEGADTAEEAQKALQESRKHRTAARLADSGLPGDQPKPMALRNRNRTTAGPVEDSDEKEAKFEEGVSADPTKDMSPEDAKKWKVEHEKNKDNFKTAAWEPSMQKKFDRLLEKVRQTAEVVGAEFSVRKGYSGRGMFGKVSPAAFVSDENPGSLLGQKWVRAGFTYDNMGRNYIYYIARPAIPADSYEPDPGDGDDLSKRSMEFPNKKALKKHPDADKSQRDNHPGSEKAAADMTVYRDLRQQFMALVAALKQQAFAMDPRMGTWAADYDAYEAKHLNKWGERSTPALFATLNVYVRSSEDAAKVKRWLATNGKKFNVVKMKVGMSPERSNSAYLTPEQWMFYLMLVPDDVTTGTEEGKFANLEEAWGEVIAKGAAATTKEDWEQALHKDEADLKKLHQSIAKLEKGEKVENLTLENAKKIVQSLEAVIGNKKDLISKLAGQGLYGFTKGVQSDCEGSVKKLTKVANRIAKAAWEKDEKVVGFLTAHAKRADSVPAKILLAAMKGLGPQVAEEVEEEAESTTDEGTAKEAGRGKHGLYGFKAKTSALGLASCSDLQSEAGQVVGELHSRRADRHANITGFLTKHAEEGKCLYSKLLCASYPDPDIKTASGPATEWLVWDA